MKRAVILFLATLLCGAIVAGAQEKPGVAPLVKTVNGYLSWVESEMVPAVEAMPADKFNFAPTQGEFKGVRTFAQQATHIAVENYLVGSAILREKSPVALGNGEFANPPKTKEEIVKLRKDSFAYAHKAFLSINDENAYVEIQSPWNPKGKINNVALAIGTIAHPWDHYGQMVEYLRMNQIIPPASRPKEKK